MFTQRLQHILIVINADQIKYTQNIGRAIIKAAKVQPFEAMSGTSGAMVITVTM